MAGDRKLVGGKIREEERQALSVPASKAGTTTFLGFSFICAVLSGRCFNTTAMSGQVTGSWSVGMRGEENTQQLSVVACKAGDITLSWLRSSYYNNGSSVFFCIFFIYIMEVKCCQKNLPTKSFQI